MTASPQTMPGGPAPTGPADASVPGRIVVDRLGKSFGRGVRAVDDLSFTVEPGSVTGFLGPNGAGKTTTLRMILGLVRPSSGHATIGGRAYREINDPSRVVGAALESSSYHPARTARNHLRIMCVVAGLPESRADEVLHLVGLDGAARRKVRGYSLGMRQRLGLATALIGNPAVLILDEPANGLDPDGIRWLRGFLRALADEGRTVLVSSHQLAEIQEIADRVVILNHGRLVRSGSIAELTAGTDRVVVRTPGVEVLAAALSQRGAQVLRIGPDALEVRGPDAPQVGRIAFEAGVEVHELRGERSDLEDLFFSLTAAQPAQHGAPGPNGPQQFGPPPFGGPPPQFGPPQFGPPPYGPAQSGGHTS